MPSRRRNGFILGIAMIGLFLLPVLTSYAETTNYVYDELNRLHRVEYEDGRVVIYTYDSAGNRLHTAALQTNDTTPPTTTPNPLGGAYNSPRSVVLTCDDGTGSGCDKTYYTTNGSTPTINSPVYTAPISISVNTTLKFFSTDLAGNTETWRPAAYIIDTTTVPTGTVTINSGAAYTNSTNATLTLTCSDTYGCDQMQFANETGSYSSPESYASSKSWTLSSGDGNKIVHAKFKNTIGNWSLPIDSNPSIFLDTVNPTAAASPTGGTFTSSVTVTLSPYDSSGSTCTIYYTTDGSTPTVSSPVYTAPLTFTTTTSLRFFARDQAGNNGDVVPQTYTISSGGGGCSSPTAQIGSTNYTSLQAAYNAAVNGDIIKCRNLTFTQNITINRNISVTLEGGYNCEFTANTGNVTNIQGKITTTAGGGTITVRNIVLQR